MLRYSLIFFIVALAAAAFGFGGLVAGAVEIARSLSFVFLAVTIVTFIFGISELCTGTGLPTDSPVLRQSFQPEDPT